jgi:MFS family permease
MNASMFRIIGVAVGASSVVAFPVVLVGGLAVLLQRDLGFGEAQLGSAVAAYFASAALTAAPGGRLAERLGPRVSAWLGLGCATVSLLGIGWVVNSWASLVAFLALGGIGNTLGQLAMNLLLARGISADRQGLAFGAKQAAVPLAALLAGLSLPAIGLTLGWRWAFLLAALLAPVTALTLPRDDVTRRRGAESRQGDAPMPALIMLTIGVALASAGGNSSAAFIVASSVDRGFAASDAGLVLAVGALVGLTIRVAAGWLGDRLRRGSLLLVAGLITIGGVGYLGLALADHPVLVVVFACLAFGGGWGWGGLVLLALSRSNPSAPATAMGVVQIGPMAGAVVGPLAFGALAEHVSFTASWLLMALMAVLGLITVLLSRRRLRAGGISSERLAS